MTDSIWKASISQINQLYLTMVKAGAEEDPELASLLFSLDPDTVAELRKMALADLVQLAQEDVCLVTLNSHFDELQRSRLDPRLFRSAKFRAFTNLPTPKQNVR